VESEAGELGQTGINLRTAAEAAKGFADAVEDAIPKGPEKGTEVDPPLSPDPDTPDIRQAGDEPAPATLTAAGEGSPDADGAGLHADLGVEFGGSELMATS
jgi:hypothetical protein